MQAFQSSAAFYEVLFDSKARLQREEALLRAAFNVAPGSRVLDLACGTGPHAHFYAELGATVTACDVSEEMIRTAAQQRPHVNITYRQGDMRHIDGGPWDMAVCLGNSLSLLPDAVAVSEVFAQLRDVLAPGGYFLLQILNYAHPRFEKPQHYLTHRMLGEKEVVAMKNFAPHRDVTLFSLSFYAFETTRVQAVSEATILLHLSRDFLQRTAEAEGFKCDICYGNFDAAPYEEENATDLIMRFQRH